MDNPNMKTVLQTLAESFAQNSVIKKVYGEPITAQGKTIITVAKVSQGFGGGFGEKNGKADGPSEPAAGGSKAAKADATGGGGGMGGGMSATPVGFIEITDSYSRFVRFDKSRYLLMGAVAGVLASLLWQKGSLFGKPIGNKVLEEIKKKDKKKKK